MKNPTPPPGPISVKRKRAVTVLAAMMNLRPMPEKTMSKRA